MKLLIHDVGDEEISLLDYPRDETEVISAAGNYPSCLGCFDCWLKTPGMCKIGDSIRDIGGIIGRSEDIIIVSHSCYGGFSPEVKAVLDRSISFNLPFFTYREGMLHHPMRYKCARKLTVCIYGDITAIEEDTTRSLVEANRINMGCSSARLIFIADSSGLGEVEL